MNRFSLKPFLGCLLLCLLSWSELLAGDYAYTLTWQSPNTHTYTIVLKTQAESGTYTDFRVAAWRPGRYIMQDYAGAVSAFSAKTSSGKALKWRKVNKDTWRVMHAEKTQALEIQYNYFANNQDAGSSFLGEGQAYFNGVNLFMSIPGRYDDPATLNVPSLPKDWKIATALKKTGDKSFSASSFHELVDSPTVFAKQMKQLKFQDKGVTFYLHFQGDYRGGSETDKAAITNIKAIVQEQVAIFGEYPFKEYHFIYRLLPFDMRHAVEHSYSASFALPDRVCNSPEAIKSIYGISSHEFWHVWNVKRIRPAALMPYDYSTPPYTGLHWFTEGVTQYYTQLTMARAGVISHDKFLVDIGNTLSNIGNSYAASQISPTQSSLDSWLAISPYKNKHFSISYYTLGYRAGLILDLEMRSQTGVTMDDLFRELYFTYYKQGKGVPEDGIQQAVEKLTRRNWQPFFDRFIYGPETADYTTIFSRFGIKVTKAPKEKTTLERLGITRFDQISQGLLIRDLHLDGDAYKAGLGVGDLIMTIDEKDAARINLEAFMERTRKGKTLKMKIVTEMNKIKSVNVPYMGAFTPSQYTLEAKTKASTRQTQLYEQWLQSVQ